MEMDLKLENYKDKEIIVVAGGTGLSPVKRNSRLFF